MLPTNYGPVRTRGFFSNVVIIPKSSIKTQEFVRFEIDPSRRTTKVDWFTRTRDCQFLPPTPTTLTATSNPNFLIALNVVDALYTYRPC